MLQFTGELFATLVSNIDLQSLQLQQDLLIIPECLFALPPTNTEKNTSQHRLGLKLQIRRQAETDS